MKRKIEIGKVLWLTFWRLLVLTIFVLFFYFPIATPWHFYEQINGVDNATLTKVTVVENNIKKQKLKLEGQIYRTNETINFVYYYPLNWEKQIKKKLENHKYYDRSVKGIMNIFTAVYTIILCFSIIIVPLLIFGAGRPIGFWNLFCKTKYSSIRTTNDYNYDDYGTILSLKYYFQDKIDTEKLKQYFS